MTLEQGWSELIVPEEGAVQGAVRFSVDGWRRHVLISWCAEAAQPWLSFSSTLCQIECCQGLRFNESKQLGKEYKQTRTLSLVYTPSLLFFVLHHVFHGLAFVRCFQEEMPPRSGKHMSQVILFRTSMFCSFILQSKVQHQVCAD